MPSTKSPHDAVPRGTVRLWRRHSAALALAAAFFLVVGLESAEARDFIRGDANNDGRVDISDGISILDFLFVGGPAPVCMDAADSNDAGRVDLSSAVFVLSALFAGETLPPPGLSCGPDPTPSDPLDCAESTCPDVDPRPFKERLVHRWAPIHLQDVDQGGCHSEDGKSDWVTAVDYDGDWRTINNWDNLLDHELTAHCYYSVVTSETHWFITYSFYHPRDWAESCANVLDMHENDLEGLLAIIRRPTSGAESEYGTYEGMITAYHLDFYSFTAPGSRLSEGNQSIDGEVSFDTFDGELHPITAQQAKGHGLKAYPYVGIDSTAIRYVPGGVAEEPPHSNLPTVSYRLVDIFEPGGMWSRRFDPDTFVNGGQFVGDDYQDNSAKTPWMWDDQNDGDDWTGGELATKPIEIVSDYFDSSVAFSTTYVENPFWGILPPPAGSTRVPLSLSIVVPQLTRGDNEFAGHGPKVEISTQIRIGGGGAVIEARSTMTATEWDGDFCTEGSTTGDRTTGTATSPWMPVGFAPGGRTIAQIYGPTSSSFCYVDTDHDVDIFLPDGVVAQYQIIGDSSGGDVEDDTLGIAILPPINVRLQ